MSSPLAKRFLKMFEADPALHTVLDIGLKLPKRFRLRYSRVKKLESGTSKASILTLKPQSYKPFCLSSKNVNEQYISNEAGDAVSSSGSYAWYELDSELCTYLQTNRDKLVHNLKKEWYPVRTKHPKARK